MHKNYFAIVSILLVLVLPNSVNADGLLSEVDANNQAFAKAILSKDVDYLVNSYTEDGCIIAPNSPKICGKDAIRGFWEGVVASEPQDVKIHTQIAGSDSDLAYATGELLITDSESNTHKNRFVLVLKNVGADWKLHIDTWTPQ